MLKLLLILIIYLAVLIISFAREISLLLKQFEILNYPYAF